MTTWSLRVRYHECDPQGIAFNANYLAWADMGTFEFWRAVFGGYDKVVEAGVETVVVAAELQFHSASRFDDVLDAETRVSAIGRTSFALTTALRRGGTDIATIVVRHVFVDRSLARSTEPPRPIAEALAKVYGESDR